MRIIVTGAGGMLGKALGRVMDKGEVVYRPYSHAELDVTDRLAVETALSSERPDLVIHAAAFTKVDDCESERELTFAVNAEGTRKVAEAASALRARLVYISTDYVFKGQKGVPYLEEDDPAPINVYGESKLEGERAVRQVMSEGKWVIVRTAWLYGEGGTNFVDRIVELAKAGHPLTVVDDQVGNPTWTMVVARAIREVAGSSLSGIYNVACSGAVSWFDLTAEILRLTGTDVPLKAISTKELRRPASRPSYSALDTSKFQRDTGLALESWKEALTAYFKEQGLI